ncbi:histidinol-phosphate aminotransferase [Pseudomonas putida]|nr:histidinol-phosphate aminotransferase [Pseudomonas putida]
MSKFWSPFVKDLVPYVPGEQPKVANLVKLNTNENPYGPSPKAIEAMRAELSDALRLYPDPNSDLLKQAVADYYGVQTNKVFLGNGSDEVLAHIFHGLFQHDQPLLFPDISYSFYPVYCGLYGIPFEAVPLDDQFQIRAHDYAKPNAGIIFPNPNAPTGCLLPLEAVEQIVKASPDSVVVVDEAYVDFGLIEALERIKNSFNSYPIDRIAVAGAAAAFADTAYFEDTCAKVIASREKLVEGLHQRGFDVLPSAANFIFAHHPEQDAAGIAARLREKGVIVRHFKQERIAQFLRISIGTPEQNQALLDAL